MFKKDCCKIFCDLISVQVLFKKRIVFFFFITVSILNCQCNKSRAEQSFYSELGELKKGGGGGGRGGFSISQRSETDQTHYLQKSRICCCQLI